MAVPLTKPVSRRVHVKGRGDYVVTIGEDCVSIRRARCRKSKAVTLPYDLLAMRALEHHAYLLNGKEWADPLRTLGKLRRLKTRA